MRRLHCNRNDRQIWAERKEQVMLCVVAIRWADAQEYHARLSHRIRLAVLSGSERRLSDIIPTDVFLLDP
jgi:hypothetical protein